MSGRAFLYRQGRYWSLGVHGYQFYTTTANPRYVEGDPQQFLPNWMPAGSGVFIPEPKRGQSAKPPKPIGSLVERPPEGTPNAWVYTPLPSSSGMAEAISTIFKAKNIWQVSGLPEHTNYLTRQTSTGEWKATTACVTAWTQMDGGISYFGAYAPTVQSAMVDMAYDLAPGRLPAGGFTKTQMPNGDWPDRGAIQIVNHPDWGTRRFFILSTADGAWHCWPLGTELDASLGQQSSYANQQDKTNVQAAYAKRYEWPYPDWVYRPPRQRRASLAAREAPPLDPRITWSFNRTATKAIAVMVQRTPWIAHYQVLNLDETPPEEQTTTVQARVDSETRWYGYPSGNKEVPQIDRPGLVELGFTITLTGPDPEDFSFTVHLLSNQPPSDTAPWRVAVAYALATDWSASGLGIAPDDRIEAWLYAWRHNDEIAWLSAQDGAHGSEFPTLGRLDLTVNGATVRSLPLVTIEGRLVGRVADEHLPEPWRAFYNNIEWLDLASLSWWEHTIIRQVTLESTPSDTGTINDLHCQQRYQWIDLGKVARCVVMNRSRQEVQLGVNPGLAATWRDQPLSPGNNWTLIQPSETGPIRGRQNNVQVPCWWLLGACRDALVREIGRRCYAEYEWDQDDDQVLANWYYTQPQEDELEQGVGLSDLDTDNFTEQFLDRVLAQRYSHALAWTWSWESTPTLLASDYRDTGPWLAANPRFTFSGEDNDWADRIAPLLWGIVVRVRTAIQEAVAAERMIWDGEHHQECIDLIANLWARAANEQSGMMRAIWLNLNTDDLDHDHWRLADAPLGIFDYTNLLHCALTTSDPYGKILVHPAGHYSFAGHVVAPNRRISGLAEWRTTDGDLYCDSDTDTGNPLNLPASGLLDWKLLDQIGWYHGALTTTHRAAYQAAFGSTLNEADLAPPSYLYVTNNELVAEPFNGIWGRVDKLQGLDNWYTSHAFITQPWTVDRRSAHTEVRLSPQFI